MDNYTKLLERISSSSGLKQEEIERKIEAKRAKLSGLVSKEGAAQIVAAELGLNLDNEKLKISELIQGMKRASIIGKVLSIGPVRSYNKNGREGKVGRLVIADESANIPAVLWDTTHISLIEDSKINVGETIEISNASVRNGELHLSSFSDLKQSKAELGEVVTSKSYFAKNFKEVSPGLYLKNRAFIVQTFEPRYFEVCPECRKKAVDGECATHGKIKSERRALLNLVLDDGTETVRSVVFHDQLTKLGLTEEEIFSLEKFNQVKESLLGEEKIFSGIVKTNQLYNTTEFTIQDIEEINTDVLINELESKE